MDQQNTINQVFIAQMEELNASINQKTANDWLSPAFIEAYEDHLNRRIKRSKNWSHINSIIQLLFLSLIFLGSRFFNGISFIEPKFAIPIVFIVMIVFNIFSSRQQKLMNNYEKQLLLIDTYKKIQ
jgi:hypothetical protein